MYVLPNALQNIPDSVSQYVRTSEKQQVFSTHIRQLLRENDSIDNSDAIDWLWQRYIDTSTFQGPDVYFFQYNGVVTIRWFTLHRKEDGIHIFFEPDGEEEFSIGEFLAEVESFHVRYMEQMKQRIDFVVEHNPVPNVFLDVSETYEVYERRKSSLKEAMEKPPLVTDWSVVLTAINKLGTLS